MDALFGPRKAGKFCVSRQLLLAAPVLKQDSCRKSGIRTDRAVAITGAIGKAAAENRAAAAIAS